MSIISYGENHTNNENKLFDTKEAAEYLGLKNHNSLYVVQHHKRWQLPYLKIGRNVRYRKSDLDTFLLANLHNNGGVV